MYELCAPALIYLIFSILQIIYDIYNKLYDSALLKFFICIMITFLLNTLCQKNLQIIAWLIISIPFIMMTTITLILIYIFGFNKNTGKINCNVSTPSLQVATAMSSINKSSSTLPTSSKTLYATSHVNSPTTLPVFPINYSSSPAYS